ncbi:MAG: prepilin-type N-terminal cleavage/methylation domain-containing protein [Verrucomicrobiota bacterium]
MAQNESTTSTGARNGFTFIEVLVALLMASILVSVACSAIITLLRAEQTADRLREGGFLARQVSAETYLGLVTTGLEVQVDSAWAADSEIVPDDSETEPGLWRVWTLYPKDRPSLRTAVATREELAVEP